MLLLASIFVIVIFGQMKSIWLVLSGVCLSVFMLGCEVGGGGSDDSSSSGKGPDDLDISSARTLGVHQESIAQNAAITRELTSANVAGGNVVMAFPSLDWPKAGGGKRVDGSVHLFWKEGAQVVGGYFDAHGAGQTTKGLENVYGGYLSGQQPPHGATVYFALVSFDVSQRTNVRRSETPW